MAPESERAMKCEHGEDRFRCPYKTCVETRYAEPNEPTLTCSEVVERLVKAEVLPDFEWNRTEATAILHSWRERRVQELEIALRELESAASVLVNENDFGRNAINRLVDARTKGEDALANSEQIRKGANHD